MKLSTPIERRAKAAKVLKGAGYERGDDVAQDRRMIADAVHKHERNMHAGEKPTPLARGGRAKRPSRTKINIMIGHPSPPPAVPLPVPAPVQGGGPGMAGAPMPPAGLRPPGMKRGGRMGSYRDMTAGSESGEGRLQKTAIARSKRGGK